MPAPPRAAPFALEPLSWMRDDIEQQLLFRGGRFTRVNSWCSFALAVLMTCAFYAALFPFRDNLIAGSFFFARNRETPACIVFLSCWSLAYTRNARARWAAVFGSSASFNSFIATYRSRTSVGSASMPAHTKPF